MKHEFILNNGVPIPSIGFGTYKAPDGQEAVAAVRYAIRAGYRHIDCAAAYACHRRIRPRSR